ncbi:MAG: type 4a pilus biogenesis protein PilO [Candidatus Berkelbacteria bacterium]|nr:MAG: type 4a pilus biogenesis protein PilO [Candidatus Berkelbacteria bacterium]QQG51469.1 MAG: type 4a pilus biogenesis protein PilO [Candidatus Berkelbacteria bacterium]
MLNKSNRGFLLLLVAIIGWFFIVRPQINVFTERSLESKVKQEELFSYEQRIEDITFIRDKGESIQSVLRAQYLAMPKTGQIPEVLVMIEALAASSGVTLGSATVGEANGSEVPVTVAFTGGLGTVTSFLNSLHNNIRTVIIKDQSMIADNNGTLTVTMQLGLVFQGEAQ